MSESCKVSHKPGNIFSHRKRMHYRLIAARGFSTCLFFLVTFLFIYFPAIAQQDSAINIMKPAAFDSTTKAAFKDSIPDPPSRRKKAELKYPTSFTGIDSINHNRGWQLIDTVSDRDEIYHPM